jgi:hypothetical protein
VASKTKWHAGDRFCFPPHTGQIVREGHWLTVSESISTRARRLNNNYNDGKSVYRQTSLWTGIRHYKHLLRISERTTIPQKASIQQNPNNGPFANFIPCTSEKVSLLRVNPGQHVEKVSLSYLTLRGPGTDYPGIGYPDLDFLLKLLPFVSEQHYSHFPWRFLMHVLKDHT